MRSRKENAYIISSLEMQSGHCPQLYRIWKKVRGWFFQGSSTAFHSYCFIYWNLDRIKFLPKSDEFPGWIACWSHIRLKATSALYDMLTAIWFRSVGTTPGTSSLEQWFPSTFESPGELFQNILSKLHPWPPEWESPELRILEIVL